MTTTTQTGSQSAAILAHLEAGGELTALDALKKFQCSRLSARILDLNRAGHNIGSEWVKTATGKQVKSYFLRK